MDPRVIYLREMLHEVCIRSGNCHFYHLPVVVASVVKEKKGLYPNVDFFAAPLLFSLGIPVDLFTAVFAASRIAGWTAHVMEQHENNRLLRPLSEYAGDLGKPYVSIEQRNGHLPKDSIQLVQ